MSVYQNVRLGTLAAYEKFIEDVETPTPMMVNILYFLLVDFLWMQV